MRLDGHGRIDRTRALSFTFDGAAIPAYAGDTVASALLAAGKRMVARSFKYHRPRGIFSAGSEEPSALVTQHRGQAQSPNTRATMAEVFDGLEVRSQNAWPSLRYDLMAVNDLAAPLLGAGFYYKTFMWPPRAWEALYEPIIRRAAGLGALSGAAPEDDGERAFAFCDLLVIGSGPAGLMAALTAGREGARVILAEEMPDFGGRLLAEDEEIDGRPGADWAAEAVAELAAMDNVTLMTRTTIIGAYDQGVFGALERVSEHLAQAGDAPQTCFWRITARRAILAGGALERPLAFADNDRPGIMLAGAVRRYLHHFGVSPGHAVAVFGNNDDAHRTARDLARAGVNVVAMLDSRPDAPATGDIPLYTAARVISTQGRHGLESLRFTHSGGERAIRVDCLAVSGGWNPAVHLTCHMGARPVWREDIAAFVPREGAVPGLVAAGAAAGALSTHGALRTGRDAAVTALMDLGRSLAVPDLPLAEDAAVAVSPLWTVPGRGRKWLDLQNDVTVKDVELAARENFRSVEHMKRYTTQGMATDQGKTSNVAALAVLAEATDRTIPQTGTTTFRPPYEPVPIAAMGAGGAGRGFAPERLTTSHAASVARGAPMIEAGLWYRPSYFPARGEETWRQSCDREVGFIRGTVGVADVSTLGKIDVQGTGAAALLDFVYAGTMSGLSPGRIKYGLMLREDGHVFDDGTCARMSEGHFLVTTTTALAGPVMAHMDFAAQVLRRDLDVTLASVTEAWAQFAVAGPRSRDLLGGLLDEMPDLAFMAHAAVGVGGIRARLFRISFSGELGYEIAVPARFGASLWRLLVAAAENLGGGPYGMEALNVARIEKGFITHAEAHGRTTAFDLGLEGMVSKKTDCIGLAASRREGLLDPGRERLVGLRPIGGALTAGAHLFADRAPATRQGDQGYITSACHSPSFGHDIALGFLKRGPDRHGEIVRAVDHMRGVETRAEVVSPVFLDPDGGRMRG